MALGLLRRFDAGQNNSLPNQSLQCSFLSNLIMKGFNRLEQHDPLVLEVLYAAAPGFCGLIKSHIQKVLGKYMSGIYCISSYERFIHVLYLEYTIHQ
jgi:hypothetical protein